MGAWEVVGPQQCDDEDDDVLGEERVGEDFMHGDNDDDDALGEERAGEDSMDAN